MEVTVTTWAIALIGLGLISLLASLQLVAVLRRRASWTIDNVYGGSPDQTDPVAYFAFNQAFAWAGAQARACPTRTRQMLLSAASGCEPCGKVVVTDFVQGLPVVVDERSVVDVEQALAGLVDPD